MKNLNKKIIKIINQNCFGKQLNNNQFCSDIEKLIIKFTKYHCIKQVRAIKKKAKLTGIAYGNDKSISDYEIDQDSIINAYPLTKIK